MIVPVEMLASWYCIGIFDIFSVVIEPGGLARQLKLMTFSPNWETRQVFTKGRHHDFLTENNPLCTFWVSRMLCSTSMGSRKQQCSGYGKETQNKALQIISFKDRTEPSDPFYANHKILKLQNIITLNNCLFIYNQIYDNLRNAFSNYFKLLKGIVKWTEPCKCVILLVSRILWHKRINPCLKEWRFWYLILTGDFPP